jgi:hypothetical protein
MFPQVDTIRPRRKPFLKAKILLTTQHLAGPASSPTKYSRGRLFHIIFSEAPLFGETARQPGPDFMEFLQMALHLTSSFSFARLQGILRN